MADKKIMVNPRTPEDDYVKAVDAYKKWEEDYTQWSVD